MEESRKRWKTNVHNGILLHGTYISHGTKLFLIIFKKREPLLYIYRVKQWTIWIRPRRFKSEKRAAIKLIFYNMCRYVLYINTIKKKKNVLAVLRGYTHRPAGSHGYFRSGCPWKPVFDTITAATPRRQLFFSDHLFFFILIVHH